MTRVIVDDALFTRLHDLAQPVELCDKAGHVLGCFVPALDREQYEGLEPQISAEELQRCKLNKGKTYTTAEVLARLEKL